MPTLLEQREDLVRSVREIVDRAKAEGRDLNPDEQQEIGGKLTGVKTLDETEHNAKSSARLIKSIAELGGGSAPTDDGDGPSAASIGEHFVKSAAYAEMTARKSSRFTVGTPEWKAAPAAIQSTGLGQVQYGGIVPAVLTRPVVADLMSAGTLSGTSLTYFVQGATTGAPAPTAEDTEKPGLVFAFAPASEVLTKIAAVTKITDETSEDASAVVSIIDSQLRQRLGLAEEAQLVSGSGTPPALRGILNRSGIQTETATAAIDNAPAIYRAMTKVQTATQLSADCLIIHPTDYQRERLAKDLNGQYVGGGPFFGQYGVGGIAEYPPLWGLRTVVTTAVAAGTALVAAAKVSSQVFRKGGVRVESTNSDDQDFRFNRIAIRIEERLLLAVYIPAAWVKVTLSAV